jgi:hypothetical protein
MQAFAVVGIRQAIGDAFELRCSEGAEVADLIEEVAADFEVFVDGGVQTGVWEAVLHGKEGGDIFEKVVEEVVIGVAFWLEGGGLVDELGVEGELLDERVDQSVDMVLQLDGRRGTWK